MFITFIEQFVKLSHARAENTNYYVCKRVIEHLLCLKWVSKVKKTKNKKLDILIVFCWLI